MSNTIHIDIEFETHFFFALLPNLSVLYKQKKKKKKHETHGRAHSFPANCYY